MTGQQDRTAGTRKPDILTKLKICGTVTNNIYF
jgi:hypothetical protein